MGGALRKTMVYLGLAEDDERYEAWDVEDETGEDADDDPRNTDEPSNRGDEGQDADAAKPPAGT